MSPVAKIASSPRRVSAAVQARTYHCHSTVDLAVCSPGMSRPLILYPTQAFSSRFTVRQLDLHRFTMLVVSQLPDWRYLAFDSTRIALVDLSIEKQAPALASSRPVGFGKLCDVTSWWYKGT